MNSDQRIHAAQTLFDAYVGPGSESWQIGRKVVERILGGRQLSELGKSETKMLLRGYNWAGLHQVEHSVALDAVKRWGDEFLVELSSTHYNAFQGDSFLVEADKLIADKVGPPSYWHMRKAWYYSMVATGELEKEDYVWAIGDPIVNQDALRLAAAELEAAYSLGLPKALPNIEYWEEFECVFSQPSYTHLKSMREKT